MKPGDEPLQRAEVLLDRKHTDEDGGVVHVRVLRIHSSPDFPEGVKYRLAYIPRGESRPAILYDIHRGKGHHRHYGEREEAYHFRDVQGLLDDFKSDLAEFRKRDA